MKYWVANATFIVAPAEANVSCNWMGVRPSFPDNLPAIGELAGLPGLFAAFGHSHYGLGMAPAG